MLYTTLSLASVVASASAGVGPSMERYTQVLANKARTWEPAHPKDNKFAGWSDERIKGLMGLKETSLVDKSNYDAAAKKFFNSKPQANHLSLDELPTNFDARTKFGGCIGAIRDQAQCGSCWAFGAAETLSDNLCIQGVHSGPLSPQDLVSCDTNDHGCDGGDLIDAWNRLQNTGIVDDSCMPYTAGGGDVASCPGYCTGSGSFTRHKCPGSYNMLDDETAIKNGVYQQGAAETGFYVYPDFEDYQSGIYHHDNSTSNFPLGGHAVKIIGWGESLGIKYWLVANSWGSSWGMSGFFKIDMADKDSAFALGGAFNCGSLAPPPPSPTPAPACEDILPTDECMETGTDCSVRHYVCAKTCKCCDYYNPPPYCAERSYNATH